MKHRFYHYHSRQANERTLSAADLAAIEAAGDHARGCFAQEARVFPPPLPADPEVAALCLEEWHAVLDDLSSLAAVSPLVPGPGRSPTAKHRAETSARDRERIAFRVKAGALVLAGGHSWVTQAPPASPVFRSGTPPPAESVVMYSDIVALDDACLLLELRASDEELRLNISGGGKNESKLYISLYTNGGLVEKSLLGAEVSWDLSDSEPGLYQLDCGDKPALSFQIQE